MSLPGSNVRSASSNRANQRTGTCQVAVRIHGRASGCATFQRSITKTLAIAASSTALVTAIKAATGLTAQVVMRLFQRTLVVVGLLKRADVDVTVRIRTTVQVDETPLS